MKNSMMDLHNHLFAQIERLGAEGLTAEELDMEIRRAKSLNETASQINEIAKTSLKAIKLQAEYSTSPTNVPTLFLLS